MTRINLHYGGRLVDQKSFYEFEETSTKAMTIESVSKIKAMSKYYKYT